MSHPLLVVCEAPDDFALASRLIDRTIQEHGPDWARDDLTVAREYFGIDPEREPSEELFVRWKNLAAVVAHAAGDTSRVRRLQLDTHQFGDSLPDHPDAFAFLRFVRVIQTSDRVRQPAAFVLLKDADSHSQARVDVRNLNSHPVFKRFPAVVGVPDPETECWILAGFSHEATDAEQKQIAEMQRLLDGVHPCRDSHKLRAPNEGDDRHPKQVLRQLTSGNGDRVRDCLDAPFTLLRSHGQENGLVAFLDALQHRLVPGLFGGRSSGPGGG
jgi:hypothetical protein